MSDALPRFSIITAVYNGADFLPELIESVQQQTFSDYEHIIIDDGSTDDGATLAVLERYATDDPRIRWWTRENKGAYATQQEGLKSARGDYIVVINADDLFVVPDALTVAASHLDAQPKCDVLYGKTERIDSSGAVLPNIEPHWRTSQWLIRQICYVQHCSMFVSRQYLTTHQLWLNLDYPYAADWDWIIRLFQHSDNVMRIDEAIGRFRLHDKQRSRTGLGGLEGDARRIAREYGGSYRLHVFLMWVKTWRAMILIALDTFRKQGPRAFFARISAWVKKRLGR